MAKAPNSLMAGVRFWFMATGMPTHLDYPVLYERLNTPSSSGILKLLQDGADHSTNTPVSTMVLYPGTGYRYDMQRFFCRKIWNMEFYSSDVDHFFKNAWLEIWSTFCMGEKNEEYLVKDRRVFLLHHLSLVQGWGRLFMIHCWYTMSMMFSNGWRGTESTLRRHLFCKPGGMNGREWVRVTGGFPLRTLVLIIWESSCSFFFYKTFLHIWPLERNYSASSTYFPLVLRPDFECLLPLLPLTPVLLYFHQALLCRYMYSEKQLESLFKIKSDASCEWTDDRTHLMICFQLPWHVPGHYF